MRLIISLLCLVLLWGCSGNSPMEEDTTPPIKPEMVQHLGDTHLEIGIDGVINEVNYYEGEIEKNGIDAVPDGDWIQIQWHRLVDLEEINYIKVHRFSLEDYESGMEDYVVAVDSFSTPQHNYYVDTSNPTIDLTWFYFIEVFDAAGNSTLSDTVGYRLINKPTLHFPLSGTYMLEDLEFGWGIGSQPILTLYVFDEDRNLIWQYSPLDNTSSSVVYNGPDFDGDMIIWRIDGAETQVNFYQMNDKEYIIYSGSESNEKVLYLQ